MEAENAFALSLVECGHIDPVLVAGEKARTLKRGGLVEVIETKPRLDDIGGLDALKRWLSQRRPAFGAAARDYGLPVPKGLLIVGIPGTGKSLTAKATASVLQLPLLRLDMGRVFGGIVGQSEANLRSVIRTAEAISPCVLWIDEIEKGFGGSIGSGSSDGGTSSAWKALSSKTPKAPPTREDRHPAAHSSSSSLSPPLPSSLRRSTSAAASHLLSLMGATAFRPAMSPFPRTTASRYRAISWRCATSTPFGRAAASTSRSISENATT